MKHQAVEAGGLSSECERLFWCLRIDFQQGEPAILITTYLYSCILYNCISVASVHLLINACITNHR